MTAAQLANAFEQALVAAAAGAGIELHRHPAPQGEGLPVCTFVKMAGDTTHTMGKVLAWWSAIYAIRAIVEGESIVAGRALDSQLEQLVTAGFTVAGATVMLLRRDSDLELSENVGGEVYHHIGGLYRVQLTP
jgi:hypothetical protein